MSGRTDKGKARAAVADPDVKYRERYYELKKQVQEIEADNDSIHLEILKTRRNIQRVRMERAILLERLSVMPDLPPEPLLHARGLQSSDEIAPTAAALQALVREGFAGGIHGNPPISNGSHTAPRTADEEPVSTNEQASGGTLQPYPPLPPPELPEPSLLPAFHLRHQLETQPTQQPLPLPRPQMTSNAGVTRTTGSQIAFGPPAPARIG